MHSNLYELLLYFLETTNLQIHPKDTRLYRAIILRVIYSIGNIDTRTCLESLLSHGIKVGEYNPTTTTASLFQGLTTMRVVEWIEFIRYLHVPDMSVVFSSIQSAYEDDITNSPLWTLKSTFEVCVCVCVTIQIGLALSRSISLSLSLSIVCMSC